MLVWCVSVLVVPQPVLTATQPKTGTCFCIDTTGAAPDGVCIHFVSWPCSTWTDTAEPPILTDPLVNGTNVTVSWNHIDKGPCFNDLTFSYNLIWYPVVGTVFDRKEGQSGVTVPGATAYIITNLMSVTSYQVELMGFTSSDPVMYSKVAAMNFTTEGVYVCIV